MLDRTALKRQFELLRQRTAALSNETDEDLFPVWLLLTLATAHERLAAESICGGPWDRGLDAVLTDQTTETVWIVQGKLRQTPNGGFEKAKEVRAFANIAEHLAAGPEDDPEPEFWRDLANNDRGALARFSAASAKTRKSGYKVRLIFASLWRFQPQVKIDATKIVGRAGISDATIDLLGWSEVQRLLGYYIRDIAPAVPDLIIPLRSGDLRPATMGHRDLHSWTIAATGEDIAGLVDRGGEQVFARNIRRGLGDKVHVNRAIRATIREDPEMFWYLNNGLTITCDAAEPRGEALWMRGAQIINGQQTSRALHQTMKDRTYRRNLSKVMVGVRVIALGTEDSEEADEIVADVVEATNFQNAISKSDLRANDLWQIELERELAARGYRYLRKRGVQDPAAPLAFLKRKVKKEEIAVAVAGALHESLPLRRGQSPLFDPEEPYYFEIFRGRNPDYMLACHWLWRTVNRLAKGYPERQATKYLVHFEAFRRLRKTIIPRDRTFVEAAERYDTSVMIPLERALMPLFTVALRSFRANRNVDGTRMAIKPYHQREDIGVHKNFLREWSTAANRPSQSTFEKYSRAFEQALAG